MPMALSVMEMKQTVFMAYLIDALRGVNLSLAQSLV